MHIRPAKDHDADDVGTFLRRAYGPSVSHRYPERWRWQFQDNPAVKGAPSIWLAKIGKSLVGYLGLQRCTIEAGAHRLPAAAGVDFVVLPEYRGKGVGRALQHEAFGDDAVGLALSCAPAARKIKGRLGWIDAEPIPVFRHFRRLPVPFGRLAARAYAWFHVQPQDPALEITDMRSFPDSVDELWARCSPARSLAVVRDAAYLNWRYAAYLPALRYHRWMATALDDPVGVMVLRECGTPERRALKILEWFGDTVEIERGLLWKAMLLCAERDIPVIECATLSPRQQSLLRGHGFIASGMFRPMIKLPGSIDHHTARWVATLGDHDVDQFSPR